MPWQQQKVGSGSCIEGFSGVEIGNLGKKAKRPEGVMTEAKKVSKTSPKPGVGKKVEEKTSYAD